MIPDTLAVGTAITHRLTHPADESPFGAPSVKGNLSCNAAHFYVLPALSRSAHSHGGPSASTNPEFRSEPGRRYPSQFVAEEWRWPAESGHRWGSEGGDRRFPPPVERRRLFILDPLHERHQALRITLDVVGPSAAQTGRGRFLRGHLLVSLVLAVHAELLEVVGFFVHWAVLR